MIEDFFYLYYVAPIVSVHKYNIVNTLTYALILIIALYCIYRWLKTTGIAIDHTFVLATMPYVIFGGLLRVVEDTGFLGYPERVLLISPIIYFVVFLYTVVWLVGSRMLEKAGRVTSYHQTYAAGGVLAAVASALFLAWFGITTTQIDLVVLFGILGVTFISTFLVWALIRYVFRWEYVDDILYKLLIFGHMLDASATSIGIDLHPLAYVEKHVVGGALIEATGTAFAMFPLKLAVIIPAIYILELYRREDGNEALWHLILLAMIIVGMAPGLRDLGRMVLYV